jgi:hypothetical protein
MDRMPGKISNRFGSAGALCLQRIKNWQLCYLGLTPPNRWGAHGEHSRHLMMILTTAKMSLERDSPAKATPRSIPD